MTDTRPTPNGEPTTEAGRALLEREAYNSRSFALITAEDILAIESEARATATRGLDVERLEKAFVRVIDRRPTKVEVAYFYGDSIPVEHQREAFLRNVAAEYAALSNTPSRETGLTAAGTALLREWGPSDDMEGSAHSDFRAAIRKVEAEARAQGALHEILIREAEDEARATATPGLPSVTALANALHDVDDDVQFIRRDARNFPVVAGRLLAALSASGETE